MNLNKLLETYILPPKTFYREMDALLKKIGKIRSGQQFLRSIVIELDKNLGHKLHLENGRLYEKHEHEYLPVYPHERNDRNAPGNTYTIPSDSRFVRLLLKSGSRIYTKSEIAGILEPDDTKRDPCAVAFAVQRSKEKWLIFFDLISGWRKDEILFYINTIRLALNHRLLTESVDSDMQQAAQIQQSLIPEQAPAMDDYQIHAYSQQAEYVGGDFYDFYQLDYGILGVVLGDASGHGLPAALLVRDVITGLRMGLTIDGKMINVLKILNRIVQRNTWSALFASLVYGEIEDEGSFTYVNAGHPPPLLIGHNRIIELEATGTVLGALPEIELHRANVRMEPGDCLVFYSDGIIERENLQQQAFGLDRLRQIAAEYRNKSAKEMTTTIFKAVSRFGNGKKWQDDASLMVVKRLK
jgi:sigma-B regulation protein RsbU (phosphoserine phosphatase)